MFSYYNFELSNSQIVDFRTNPGLVSSSTIIVRMFCADYIASFVFHGFVSAGFLEVSFRGYFGANHAPSKVASIMSTPPVAFVNGSLAGAQYKYIFWRDEWWRVCPSPFFSIVYVSYRYARCDM